MPEAEKHDVRDEPQHDRPKGPRLDSQTRPGRKPTPGRDSLICLGIIATLLVPSLITLRTVVVPRPYIALQVHPNPSPLGYTWSLSLFLIPSIVIAVWFLTHPHKRFQRKAFWGTLALLVPVGFLLDLLRGNAFFVFPNDSATLGIGVPGVGGPIPIEEFCFYFLGFLTALIIYIWCDEYWMGEYNLPNYYEGVSDVSRVLQFHIKSLLIGAALIAGGIIYKKLISPDPVGFPGYFTFLVCVAVLPSILLFPTAHRYVNWRAFSLTFLIMFLVALFWEATLAVPYQWWGYRPEQMLGITVRAWKLPIEATVVWVVVTYTTVLIYEIFKVFLAMDGRPREKLFGRRGEVITASALPNESAVRGSMG